MARLPRYSIPEQPQHIIQRGNNRMDIFRGDGDYRFYLRCMADASKNCDVRIHAYVLMTNHVHLLASPHRRDSISKMMQSIGRKYVQYFNQAYERTGTLWEGRYRSTVIDSEKYLLSCYRYIELNPVRAGIVNNPGDYDWSSYNFHAYGKPDGIISEHKLFWAIGATKEQCRPTYRNLCTESLDTQFIREMRESTNKAWVLGDDDFKAKVEKLSKRRAKPMKRGRPTHD